MSQPADNLPAADGSRHPCEEPLSPESLLRELRAWLTHKSEHGMRETKGYGDSSGHPHYWCAVMFPDWELKQKLGQIEDTLAALEQAGRLPGAAGKE